SLICGQTSLSILSLVSWRDAIVRQAWCPRAQEEEAPYDVPIRKLDVPGPSTLRRDNRLPRVLPTFVVSWQPSHRAIGSTARGVSNPPDGGTKPVTKADDARANGGQYQCAARSRRRSGFERGPESAAA